MKKIATALLSVWLLATAATLQSCDNDDDDYYIYPYARPTAIVTVKPNADNSSFYLQVDDSTTLIPTNMKVSPFGNKEVRALVNCTPTENPTAHQGQTVTINWIDSILTKPTVANLAEKNDSAYGNDPVEIVNSFETVAEDGYLTLRFRTRWASGRPHRVNLVHRTDVNTPYLLQFYHDAAPASAAGPVADGLVAFRLDSTFNEPDTTINITLQWNSYSGTKTHTFKYKPRKD